MTPDSSTRCSKCDTPIAPDVPGKICPRCLLALSLETNTLGDENSSSEPLPQIDELQAHFPQLKILECLGRGGMGVVYRARQKSLNRDVALKLLAPERALDTGFAKRFQKEAQALAALNHPNIVTIHDFGEVNGFYYLLMEFVDGVNLRQAMGTGKFSSEQALAIIPPVCEALQFAHDHKIIHRDIKPENLLLDKEGQIKIADFGIAHILDVDTEIPLAGTPRYMAPEQKDSPENADHRVDIYALGVVLYELLTGEAPNKEFKSPSQKVQIDVRIDEIVLKALAKKPEARFATATDFRTQIETVAKSPTAKSDGLPEKAESRPSRKAIVGVCWMPFFFLCFFLMFPQVQVEVSDGSLPTTAWWQWCLRFTILPLGLTAPFGTTILGWLAIPQIRRSEGKLYGMGLAVFDGLFFPLLVLDILLGIAGWQLIQLLNNRLELDLTRIEVTLALIPIAILIAWIDYRIIRRVWRNSNRPLNSAPEQNKSSSPPQKTLTRKLMISGLILALASLGIYGVISSIQRRERTMLRTSLTTEVGNKIRQNLFNAGLACQFIHIEVADEGNYGVAKITGLERLTPGDPVPTTGRFHFIAHENGKWVVQGEHELGGQRFGFQNPAFRELPTKSLFENIPDEIPSRHIIEPKTNKTINIPDLAALLPAMRSQPYYQDWLEVRNITTFFFTTRSDHRFELELGGRYKSEEREGDIIMELRLLRPDRTLYAKITGSPENEHWTTNIYDKFGETIVHRVEWQRDANHPAGSITRITNHPETPKQEVWHLNDQGHVEFKSKH